jgi:hypothetical protein
VVSRILDKKKKKNLKGSFNYKKNSNNFNGGTLKKHKNNTTLVYFNREFFGNIIKLGSP